jgi:hypothetical protein
LVNDEFFLADNIFQYDTVEISSRIFSVFKFVEGLKNETHALLENLQHQKKNPVFMASYIIFFEVKWTIRLRDKLG